MKDDTPNISKINLVVGKIIKVWEMEGSDNLYCEHIDIGNGEIRNIASGLRQFVPIDQMLNAHVIVVANLLP